MKKAILFIAFVVLWLSGFVHQPSLELLSSTNHTLMMVNNEGQMVFETNSVLTDPLEVLRGNSGLVIGASEIFKIPTVITTVAEVSFSGSVFPEIPEAYSDKSKCVDYTTMDMWEDSNIYKALKDRGKSKLVIGGLWTSGCIVETVLDAICEGFDVYIITGTTGYAAQNVYDQSFHRMVQAGAKPITSVQYILELQIEWAKQEIYKLVNGMMAGTPNPENVNPETWYLDYLRKNRFNAHKVNLD